MYGKRVDAFALLMLIVFMFKNLAEIFKFLLIFILVGFFIFGGLTWLVNLLPLWAWIVANATLIFIILKRR